ncbi:hypothetical protein BPP43_00940 [Brachyspira pilosicoli P43/6/78]|uniref:Uncharacterized protein n=1 Tax=Brachyspira pilosicoli P43/6/78 TaxID=1042417 RepID=A0A3B6VHZ6_BRAPL|nr:hypothetical protein BPP43_00940 [Brachyspira pilosicoli P43/6/78]
MDIILYIMYFLLKVLALFGSLMKSAQRPKEVPVGAKARKRTIKFLSFLLFVRTKPHTPTSFVGIKKQKDCKHLLSSYILLMIYVFGL